MIFTSVVSMTWPSGQDARATRSCGWQANDCTWLVPCGLTKPQQHAMLYSGKSAGKPRGYIRKFFSTLPRAPQEGVPAMKEMHRWPTKCVLLQFLGLHILDSVHPRCSKRRLLRELLEWIENSAKTQFQPVLYSFAPISKFVNSTFNAINGGSFARVLPSLLNAWLWKFVRIK